MSLRIRVRALGKLSGCLLKGSKDNSAPFCQKTQVRVSAERSLMTEFAQKLAHAA